HVDMYAGLARMNGGKRMPVIRGSDNDSIDVFPLQELPVVFEDLSLPSRFGVGFLGVRRVHVADCCDLSPLAQETPHRVSSIGIRRTSGANHTDDQFVIAAQDVLDDRGGGERGSRGGRGLHKLASIQFHSAHGSFSPFADCRAKIEFFLSWLKRILPSRIAQGNRREDAKNRQEDFGFFASLW